MTSGVTHKLQVDLRYEVKTLFETFGQLSAKLAQAATEMHDPGIPPSDQLLDEMKAAQTSFAALRAQLLGLARIVETTPLPDSDAVVSLKDLAGVLQNAQETRKKSKMGEAKQQVLRKLDRVQNLVHMEKTEFVPLIDCQAHAAQLKLAIVPDDWSNPSPELVEGLLPFVDLLKMVEQLDQLDDEVCERLQTSIGAAFGRLLAVAVARGRVVLREAAPEPGMLPAGEATAPGSEGAPLPKEAAPETAPISGSEAPVPANSADSVTALAQTPGIAPAEATLAELPLPEVQELAKLATELYVRMGHEVQKSILRTDNNVDLIIRSNNGKKWLARCRSQATPVNEGEVRDFYSVMQQEKAAQGAIITLGVFAPQARQWAKSNLLYLLDNLAFA